VRLAVNPALENATVFAAWCGLVRKHHLVKTKENEILVI
jgi:hypothetical protein